MLRVITPFTSLAIYAAAEIIINDESLLCLSIEETMKLVNTSEELENKIQQLSNRQAHLKYHKNVLQLKLNDSVYKIDLYDNDNNRDLYIKNLKDYCGLLKIQNEGDKQDQGIKETTMETIELLESLISLRYETEYLLEFENLITAIKEERDTNIINHQIALIVIFRSLYITEICKYKNQAPKPLEEYRQELSITITELYNKIVQTHNKDIKYIEKILNKTTTQCVCITIEDIVTLTNGEESDDKSSLIRCLIYNYRVMVLKRAREQLEEECKQVHDISSYNYDEYQAQNRHDTLKIQLAKLQDTGVDITQLTKEIDLLMGFIYLSSEHEYLTLLINLIDYNLDQQVNQNQINESTEFMIFRRIDYLYQIKQVNNKNLESLVNYHKFQKELGISLHELDKNIVATYDVDTKYIEQNLASSTTTKCLKLKAKAIDKLNHKKNKQNELRFMNVLIKNYQNRYIFNKISQIFNILVSLKVITNLDQSRIEKLRETLEELYTNDKQKAIHILEYYIYLLARFDYLDALSNYIYVVHKNDNQIEIFHNRKNLKQQYKVYKSEKKTFKERLPEYLQFIKAHPNDKELKQCIPTPEEIEDIYEKMDVTDKQLLMKLQKDTTTGITLPGILAAVGTFVIVGIVYGIYKAIKPNKGKVKKQTKEKTNITSK